MLANTLLCLFCTFLPNQLIILSVGYKLSHCLNCFPSAFSRVDQINSDSLSARISTVLVKRVKRQDCLTVDMGYIIHFGLMRGLGDVYSPNLQLSSAVFHLFESVRNPSSTGRFSYKSQVSYHIFVYYFITRTRATRLTKHKLPSRFRQVLSAMSRRTRRPISMGLLVVPTSIKPGSDIAVASSIFSWKG